MKLSRVSGVVFACLSMIGPAVLAQGVSLDPVGPLVGTPALGANDCAGGEIYDDGGAENGYSGNAGLISTFEGVMQFTPSSYPATYDTVCLGLVSLAGANLDFEVEVRDDDGAGGTPGTLLGTLPTSVATIPGGLPCGWFQFDISSLNLNIASGSVFIGVRWNPMLFPSRFICADESVATPLHPGFVDFNNPTMWQTTQSVFPAYRAKLIRAIEGALDADLDITKTGVASPGQIVYTITVTNNGPADATGVTVTDTFPAEVAYVSDTCAGDFADGSWVIGNLANGASVACDVTVDVVTPGAINNTASVAGDQADPTPGNDSATATNTGTGAPNALEIPTLGGFGIVAMLLMLGAGALLVLRRRNA